MAKPAGDAEDRIELIDEPSPDEQTPETSKRWHVLVADDDEPVHAARSFALSNAMILGRRLSLLHAYGTEETRRIQATAPEVAVLLDVVMERTKTGWGAPSPPPRLMCK